MSVCDYKWIGASKNYRVLQLLMPLQLHRLLINMIFDINVIWSFSFNVAHIGIDQIVQSSFESDVFIENGTKSAEHKFFF